jgi:two-component system OmpR family response regulator
VRRLVRAIRADGGRGLESETVWDLYASMPGPGRTGFGEAGFTSSSHLVLGTVLVVRLLVAEDEPRLAALLRRGFEEEGYAVDVSGDGVDAEWMAREVDYATVVLDVMLPGRDGLEVCRRLREAGRWLPVVMLTARDGVADRVAGLDCGADDYVVKPFSFDELAARVRAVSRRSLSRPAVVLWCGDLALDPARHQVWRGDSELQLSGKEFALLELLMRHPGEVLTRTQIVEHVWDMNADPSSNVVDQYVAYLRRKVDRPFGRDDITTVRSVGYRLRLPPSE